MSTYDFTLTFRLPRTERDASRLVARLGKDGCTDALVGIGRTGYIALHFTRQSRSDYEAVRSALADVVRAIPRAKLLAASKSQIVAALSLGVKLTH